MKDRIMHIRKGIITSIFLILIGGVIFNSTFFLHTHRTACGKFVVHAHPFNKNTENQAPFAQHKHNKIDLNQFNSIDYFTFSQVYLKLEFRIGIELEILSKPCLNTSSTIYFLHTTRGPPPVKIS